MTLVSNNKIVSFSTAKCDEPMGVENGRISDAQLSASSARFNNDKRFGGHRARLNLESWPAGWSAKTYDSRPWLQIDFGIEKMVTAIATQGLGHSTSKEWVKTFKVAVSDDGITWFVLQSDGREKVWVPCGVFPPVHFSGLNILGKQLPFCKNWTIFTRLR